MVSSAVGLTGEDEPQLDWANGPVTLTRLSGCSRAAFTGVMELKRTPDRQPVKPREASPTKSASTSDSNSRNKHKMVFLSASSVYTYITEHLSRKTRC